MRRATALALALAAALLGCSGPGAGSCGTCGLHGRWAVRNLTPCFVEGAAVGDGGSLLAAVSSIERNGSALCPLQPALPAEPWSADTFTVDCPGQYRLCVTLKAGDGRAPRASDCAMAVSCAEGDAGVAGTSLPWAPLPAWLATGAQLDCAAAFRQGGGYAEASLSGTAAGCGAVAERVLWRVGFAPVRCQADPGGAGCGPLVGNDGGGF